MGNCACCCMLRICLPLNVVASIGSYPQEQTDTTAAAFLCHSSGNFAGDLKCECWVGVPLATGILAGGLSNTKFSGCWDLDFCRLNTLIKHFLILNYSFPATVVLWQLIAMLNTVFSNSNCGRIFQRLKEELLISQLMLCYLFGYRKNYVFQWFAGLKI